MGSKNFTEQVILGEIAAQLLEKRLNQPVDRKLNLGGTLLAHQALLNGSLDTYPEYTGTALTAILHLPPDADARTVFDRVNREYQTRFSLLWLPPLGFNNSFAMVVPGDLARRFRLKTLSDAAAYTPGWKLGVGYEFLDRPDGLATLRKTYQIPLDGAPVTMDLGLLYQALEQGQVTMAAGNSTDGQLANLDVVILEDDKHAFPPYQAAFVVRESTISEHPGLRETLELLSGKFTDKRMQELNDSVDGKHNSAEQTAAQFLVTAGLV